MIYHSGHELRSQFPMVLRLDGMRVLKRNRGNGGHGIWKVELADAGDVIVVEGRRGSFPSRMPLDEFLGSCEKYIDCDGALVDQPFQARLAEGMIRCYVSSDRVVGFGHQLVKALVTPAEGALPEEPGPRIMHSKAAPAFQRLRTLMERDWIPGLLRDLSIERTDLPLIWDADFLYGSRDATGADTYVLCEINVSSVLPIPPDAAPEIARSVAHMLNRGR